MRRVRLMRDSILKRRTRIDEVQVKGPSRELARLQTEKERVDSQNKAWLDNLEDNESNSKNVCLFCGRQFERRAVLLSHHKVFLCLSLESVHFNIKYTIQYCFVVGLPTKEKAEYANIIDEKSGSQPKWHKWLERKGLR